MTTKVALAAQVAKTAKTVARVEAQVAVAVEAEAEAEAAQVAKMAMAIAMTGQKAEWTPALAAPPVAWTC